MPPRRRRREPSSSSASEEDQDMILDPHMLLQFPQGTEGHTRLKRLIGMEIVEPRTIDWSILATLGATERATTIIGASGPWRRMMEMGGLPAYREIVLEFLSTFEFHPPQAGGVEALEQLRAVSFTLCGQDVEMSLTQWGIATGFYTRDGVTTPLFLDASLEEDEAVLIDWWPVIGDDPFVNKAPVSRIRDPLHRYLHRCIACTITGRRLSQEWVTQKDLFFMYCLITGRSCNLAWLLADYFASFISRKATGAITVRDLSGRVDRLEGMMRWMMERMAASAGMDVPVFPGPGPQDPGGHA
ncbi:hypothetical protein E3N88_05344 [Mikania micrantha]|uniref:Arabidopsis retrotransposon Orf1 C-terminal domain-containing protein n=1 Tax=Mikania micrantha TaxID=192012 RepID=A0A5N6PKR0_9ASTR|nr:hypothetical protein E3N88_05344 [Mikania micrantha]